MRQAHTQLVIHTPGRGLHPITRDVALTATSLSIPVLDARPTLGTWQGIYLFEHRTAPHRRSVALHLIGD